MGERMGPDCADEFAARHDFGAGSGAAEYAEAERARERYEQIRDERMGPSGADEFAARDDSGAGSFPAEYAAADRAQPQASGILADAGRSSKIRVDALADA